MDYYNQSTIIWNSLSTLPSDALWVAPPFTSNLFCDIIIGIISEISIEGWQN